MEILTVFDQTFIQPLEPRQHQSCQARGRVRSQCHGPADRDRAACVSWSGVRGDFSGTRNSRHGVRFGTPVAQKGSPNCERCCLRS